jgi:hypothetical protein
MADLEVWVVMGRPLPRWKDKPLDEALLFETKQKDLGNRSFF